MYLLIFRLLHVQCTYMQGFIQDFLLGGGGNNVSKCPPLPPGKKVTLETSEFAFQAYFDQKFVLTDLWLKNTYPLNRCGISASKLPVLSS